MERGGKMYPIAIISAEDRSILSRNMKKTEKCPFFGLKKATFNALLKTCLARRKQNRRIGQNVKNSLKSSTGIEMEITKTTVPYPACFDCKYFSEIEKGKVPKEFEKIIINLKKSG